MADEIIPPPRTVVRKELAGMWIAWNSTGTSIIASGDSLAEVMRLAEHCGEARPSFEKAPPMRMRVLAQPLPLA